MMYLFWRFKHCLFITSKIPSMVATIKEHSEWPPRQVLFLLWVLERARCKQRIFVYVVVKPQRLMLWRIVNNEFSLNFWWTYLKQKNWYFNIFLSFLLSLAEICCCIMSELEIHVSTPLRGINSVEVSVCSIGSSGDQSCRKLIVDVCNGPGAPSARIVQPGNMQMDQTNMKMKLSSKDESGVDEVLEEEELDAFTENMPSDISSSRPETPIMTGTSPPIPIPRLSPIGNSGTFIGTPTRSSSFNYMYRFSSPEETSPLSSGYGSAPRFFQSTSTQTPPLSPVLLETSISLRLFDSPSEQDSTLSPQELLRIRRQRYCEGEFWSSIYSYCSTFDKNRLFNPLWRDSNTHLKIWIITQSRCALLTRWKQIWRLI